MKSLSLTAAFELREKFIPGSVLSENIRTSVSRDC